MFCQRCGTSVPKAADFCTRCGQDIGATTPMAALPDLSARSELDVVREALEHEYEVKSEIGRGGMAMVFRGREKGLGRDVAIKVLPLSQVHNTSLVERFEQEARTSARLEHPNIIPIYRVGRSGDVIFFTMRYLEGPSLAELIGTMGTMDPAEIRRIVIESARGLGYAHEHGVIHRDIKPDNIMFKDSGTVVVCDFGIAKAVSSTKLTGTGMALGTPYYMSPEQVRARPLDGRSDQYSLGVVAFQCLTRRVPFDGEDSFAIGYKHITEEPEAPELKTGEQRKLFQIIKRMMAKEPADRFPDTDALIEALSDGSATSAVDTTVLASKPGPLPETRKSSAVSVETNAPPPVQTTPTTPIPPTAFQEVVDMTPPNKKRRTGALVAMLLLGLMGGAGGGSYYYVETTGAAPPFVERMPFLRNFLPFLNVAVADTGITVAEVQPAAEVDSTAASEADSTLLLAAAGDSAVMADSAVADSASVPDSVPPEPVVEVAPTGHLIVSNLGRRASLFLNGHEMRGVSHDLPEGRYALRVIALGYEPYDVSVFVSVGDTIRHRVRLAPESQCELFDPESYNRHGECFDVRARPARNVATLVPLTSIVPRPPVQPAILDILVRADGTPEAVRVRSPSDVPQFGILAVHFANNIAYEPATKNGTPVKAWVQVPFYAKR